MFKRQMFYNEATPIPGVSERHRLGMSVSVPLTCQQFDVSAYSPQTELLMPEPSRLEQEQLYDAILDNPFDYATRAVLADWLDEHGFYGTELMRADDQGGRPPMPIRENFHRWTGPGRIGFSDSLYTPSVWLGSLAQFPQACRSGLFTLYPITAVITYDRSAMPVWQADPTSGHVDHTACMTFETEERIAAMLESTQQVYGANRYRTLFENRLQSVINDLYGAFSRRLGVYPVKEQFDAYIAFNQISAMVHISNCLVDLGRYAVGLPDLKWPDVKIWDDYGRSGVFRYDDKQSPFFHYFYHEWHHWLTEWRRGWRHQNTDGSVGVDGLPNPSPKGWPRLGRDLIRLPLTEPVNLSAERLKRSSNPKEDVNDHLRQIRR